MRNWVTAYLNKVNPAMSKAIFNEIKKLDFAVFDGHDDMFFGEKQQKIDAYVDAMRPLIGYLNCHFEPATRFSCGNCQKFKFMFISVVASLTKENFKKLLRAKNTFYLYGPANNAYTKDFAIKKMKIPLNGRADVKVVVFNHEVATFPWLLGRYCILRELVKIIVPGGDEDTINETIRAWGFAGEMRHAKEFESTRRDAISTYYAL
jgi:hypothetical protein